MTPALALAVLAVAAADPPAPPDAARAAGKVIEVIGHRGSSHDRPENTLASFRRAIEAGAALAEVDVRTTKDGALVCMHDADVGHTTDGKGPVGGKTLDEVKALDAGSKFGPKFAGERVPTFREALATCKGRIGVLIDLKETGDRYAEAVAAEVRAHGEPKRTAVGVRSLEQVRQFKKLLPEARQIGLVPTVADIEGFAAAGVPMVRLWPKWLADPALVPRVRKLGLRIHVGTGTGTRDEVLPVLAVEPESLSSDDPAALIRTLAALKAAKP